MLNFQEAWPQRTSGPVVPMKAAAPLHAMVAAIGRQKRNEPQYSWHGLKRGEQSFAVIQHTLSGQGRLTYEGNPHPLEPGQTMLVKVPHDHHYWVQRGDQWEFCYMVIYGREVLRLTDCVLQTAGPVLKLSEAELAQLARVFADLRQQTTITPGFASACAYRAAMVLVDHMSHGSADRQRVDESPAPARLTLICRHIQTHLDADLSVESLAQRVGMTRWHFSRWFRKEKGVTPSDYVLNQRMRRATQLLSDPTTRIRDVAQACGYADAGYFGKVFDKYFGQSPRAFRNAGMFGP